MIQCSISGHAITLVVIIIIAGVFGGYSNYLIIRPQPTSDVDTTDKAMLKAVNKNLLEKSLFLGVAAAFLVPLFLTTISSNLIDSPLNYPIKNYFIFGGFCLLASISSKRFIEDIYSRIMKVEKEAIEAKAKVEVVEDVIEDLQDISTEVNEDENDSKVLLNTLKNINTIQNRPNMENAATVIGAYIGSKYSYRTLRGLSKESKLSEIEVETILNWLKALNIASSKLNKKGNLVWKIHIDQLYKRSDSSID